MNKLLLLLNLVQLYQWSPTKKWKKKKQQQQNKKENK